MRLVPVPLLDEHILGTAHHWLPFLPEIAKRSHESVDDMVGQIMRHETRLVLVMDGENAVALVGVRIVQMDGKFYGDLIWLAGNDRTHWQHLLPELEELLRLAGCVECRPFCRPGWAKLLKSKGYKMTHVIMEKAL